MKWDLMKDIKHFLDDNGASSSMQIKESMKELGYPKDAVAITLVDLKERGKVKQFEDDNGNPVNKYDLTEVKN